MRALRPSCLLLALSIAAACAQRGPAEPPPLPAPLRAAIPVAAPTTSQPQDEDAPPSDAAPAAAAEPPAAANDDGCPATPPPERLTLAEEGGPKRLFSVHGYMGRVMRIERTVGAARLRHCITVAWPPGRENSKGTPVDIARHIDDGWLRAIENTLSRVPWRHVTTLRRIVIDDMPKEHGIAPFDRAAADDGRDGRSIWLHHHLFRSPNHWARGNYGTYWSYHVSVDGRTLDDLPADHTLFSPVLLHELGHLVAYHVVRGDPAMAWLPPCATTCGENGEGCAGRSGAEREAGCISPYCKPFKFQRGTENWAEQYRFYYQSSGTRELLLRAAFGCRALLAAGDGDDAERHPAPWEAGLPDVTGFQKSRWDSCGGKACKPW